MYNIYNIFEDEQEQEFDREYYDIQESYDKILEDQVIITLEELVYNNPENKKLSVLIEEVEANEQGNVQKIIDKLKAQMQRVLNWIMNMFKHYDKLFQEGAAYVKNNDLNACMNKIKAKRIDVDVTYHAMKPPFQRMQSTCLREINIDRFITKRVRGNSDSVGAAANEEIQSGDKTENYLNTLIKNFKLSKEDLKEVKLNTVNVLTIYNDLVSLPEANRKLNNIKSKVQRLYNQAINDVRSYARGGVKGKVGIGYEKSAHKADNELAFINAQIKKLNERIRAYAKIMTMVFKEDYNLAKLIVAKANGKEYDVPTSEKPKQEQPQPQQKPQEKKETKKRWFNKPL